MQTAAGEPVLVTLVRRVSMIMPSFFRSAKRDDGANFFHAGVDASDLASGLPAREKAVGGWQNSAPRDSQNDEVSMRSLGGDEPRTRR